VRYCVGYLEMYTNASHDIICVNCVLISVIYIKVKKSNPITGLDRP